MGYFFMRKFAPFDVLNIKTGHTVLKQFSGQSAAQRLQRNGIRLFSQTGNDNFAAGTENFNKTVFFAGEVRLHDGLFCQSLFIF